MPSAVGPSVLNPNLTYRGGPRHGRSDAFDHRLPATIGDGSEGGIYHLTDAIEDGMRVYRWQPLTHAQTDALVRGDLRSNQR